MTRFLFCSAVTSRPGQPAPSGLRKSGSRRLDGRRWGKAAPGGAGAVRAAPPSLSGAAPRGSGGGGAHPRGTSGLLPLNPSGRNIALFFFFFPLTYFDYCFLRRYSARAHPRVLPSVRGRTGPPSSPCCRRDSRYGPYCTGWATPLTPQPSIAGRGAKPLPSRSQPPLVPVPGPAVQSPSGTCRFCLKHPSLCLLELALAFRAAALCLGKAVSGS